MNTNNFFKVIKNNKMSIEKVNCKEIFTIENIEKISNMVYVFGKKPNITAKYIFAFDDIYHYIFNTDGSIFVIFNNSLEYILRNI